MIHALQNQKTAKCIISIIMYHAARHRSRSQGVHGQHHRDDAKDQRLQATHLTQVHLKLQTYMS